MWRQGDSNDKTLTRRGTELVVVTAQVCLPFLDGWARAAAAAGLHDCLCRAAEWHGKHSLPPGQSAWWLCRRESQLLQTVRAALCSMPLQSWQCAVNSREAHLALLHGHG